MTEPEIQKKFEERQADAVFSMEMPICEYCQNRVQRTFSYDNPFQQIIGCEKLGEVPTEIYSIKSMKCKDFIMDKEKLELFKPFLERGFDLSSITKQ